MAANVNNKFVIFLSAALVLMVGGAGAFWFLKIRKSTAELEAIGNRHVELAEVVVVDPDGSLDQLTEAYKRRSKDYRLAAQSYGIAWKRDTSNVDLLLKYIDAYSKMPVRDNYEAQKVFRSISALIRQATEERPSDNKLLEDYYQTLYSWNRSLGYRDVFDSLYSLTSTRLETDPSNIVALKFNGISQAARISDDLDRDEQQQIRLRLEEVLASSPQDTDVLHYLARWHLYDADRLLRAEPSDPEVQASREKALGYAKQALDASPDDGLVKVEYIQTTLAAIQNVRYAVYIEPDKARSRELADYADSLRRELLPVFDGLESELRSNPDPPYVVKRVAELLPRLYRDEAGSQHSPANISEGLLRVENLLEGAVRHRPDILLYRLMLAHTYKLQLKLDDARAAYIAARDHTVLGNYEVSLRDEDLRRHATYEFTNLELIRAEAADDPAERQRILESADVAVDDLEKVIDQDPRVLVLRGKIALLRNKTTEAMQLLDRASDLYNGTNVEAMILSARARQAEKQWGGAAERLEEVLEIVRSSTKTEIQSSIRLQLAESLIFSRKYPESRQQIDYMLELQPSNPVALQILSKWYAAQDRYGEAIKILEDTGLAEKDASVAKRLAQLYQANKQEGRSREILEARFAENPGDISLLQRLLQVSTHTQEKVDLLAKAEAAGADPRAINLLRLQAVGQDGGGKLTFEQLIDHTQDEQASAFEQAIRRAKIYFQYRQIDKAREAFEVARGLDPDDDGVVVMAMDFAILDKDFEAARRLVNDAAARNLDLAKGHFFKAKLAAAEGKLRQALVSYDQGLKLRPVFADGWRQYGDLLMQVHDVDEAVAAYTTALNQKPDHARSLLGLSNAYQFQGQRTRALEVLRIAVSYVPNDRQLTDRYLAFEERYGDPGVVLQFRREIAQKRPGDFANRCALVMLLAREGDINEALQMLEVLTEEFGDRREVVAAHAQVLRSNGQAAEGAAAIRRYIAGLSGAAETRDHLLLARYLLTGRRVNESVAAYRDAIALESPGDRLASRELGDVLFNFGQHEEAALIYLDLYPATEGEERQRLGTRAAETLIKLRRIDEAREILNDPQIKPSATTHALFAMMARVEGQPDQAMKFINRSLGMNNRNALTFLQRAELLAAKSGHEDKALDDLDHALSIQPNLVQAVALKSRVLLKIDRKSEAARALRDLLELAPGNNQARLNLARLYLETEDIRAAEDLVAEGLEISPNNPAWLQASARIALSQGKDDDAIRGFETLLETNPTPRTLAQLAQLYLDRGKAGAADALLNEHAALLGDSPGLQSIRGRALAVQNKPDQAKRVFTLALERCRSLPQVAEVLGQMVLALGRDAAFETADAAPNVSDPFWVDTAAVEILLAARDFTSASSRLSALRSKLSPSETDVLSRVETVEALVKMQSGDHIGARDAFVRLLDTQPDNPAVLNNLAYLMTKNLNDPRGAVPYAEKARDLLPNNPEILDTLGLTYFQTDRISEAREVLEASVRLRPMATNTLHLARVYAADGDVARAKALLEQSIELAVQAGDNGLAEESREVLRKL